MQPTYEYYKDLFAGIPKPFAYLDLDLLDQNIASISRRAGEKTVRIASKSVRCRWVLDYLLQADDRMQGLMCFTAVEAVWLAEQGFDDLLVAYPCWEKSHVEAVSKVVSQGKRIWLMVDSAAHIQHLNQIGEALQTVIPVCLDLDLSLKLPGLHFGVFRSSVNSVETALALWTQVQQAPWTRMDALMGYEAQVAGLGDRTPGLGIKGPAVRLLKKRSVKVIAQRRAAVVEALLQAGASLPLVNGGGTGSMESTRAEAAVTEITAGSGFYASHLFDYYDNFKHLPAAGYAVEVVRQPQPGIYTCLGGGYVASGAPGVDKIPLPYLPEGARLHPNEGAGEVQTPILYKGQLKEGDPVFMRHSKAGELCERFNELLLVRAGKVIDRVPTYRGEGKCFL